MPQNGINHPGVTALAQAFAINPLLRVINLNDNTFTEKGAVAMAKVRREWRRQGGSKQVWLLPFEHTHHQVSPLCPSTRCGPGYFEHSRVGHTSQACLCHFRACPFCLPLSCLYTQLLVLHLLSEAAWLLFFSLILSSAVN